MKKEQLQANRQLQRIAALPYNHYIEQECKKIRQKYTFSGLNEEKAYEHYFQQVKKYRKSAYPLFSTDNVFAFLEPTYETEVPLEQEVLTLLRRFQLPVHAFLSVLLYIVTGRKSWLFELLFASPEVKVIWDYKKALSVANVTITGLNLWTTKKQWEQIWDNEVKQKVNAMRKALERQYGVSELGRKRCTLEAYNEQIHRWWEWYQLSEIEGLGPKRALNKWEESHPESRPKKNKRREFDLSTVTKAIKDFGDIITPISR